MTASSAHVQATTVLQAVAVSVVGVLPAFLVGALAVQVRDDLAVGPAGLGVSTAALFAVTGLLARPMGALVQRVGARRGLVTAALLSAVSLSGVGLAPTFAVLVAALAVGGAGNAIAQPAANLGLSRAIGPGRLGLAFGIKQSSIPAATLMGGLAVPGIALVVGWRWALAAGAVTALGVAAWGAATGRAAPVGPTAAENEPDRGLPRAGLLVLTVGGGVAAAASTCLGVFLVDSGVRAGLAPATSGLLFAVCSALGLLGRVGFGWAVDRHPTRSPYLLIANLLTVGAVGHVLMGTGSPVAFVLGGLAAYGAGWAWTGLFHFAVVRDNRLAAASATGFVQTGLSLGAAGGPLAFGVLAEATSYRTAWFSTALLSLVGAVTIRSGRRMVRRSRGLPVGRAR
jgi:MFS family permease